MEVKYRIIRVSPDEHSIVVRYYTDEFNEDFLATSFNIDGSIARDENGFPLRCRTDSNINIWQTNPSPDEDKIKEIIAYSAPYDWFKLQSDISNPEIDTSLSVVEKLLKKEFVAKKPQPVIFEPTPTLSEDEIEMLINSLVSNTSTSNT